MKNRKFIEINCKICNTALSIRSDYFDKHSKNCMSCSSKGNNRAKKHGDYKTRLYKIWVGLSQRRYKKGQPEIQESWQIFSNFKKWALNNGYSSDLTIDRIDNNIGYYESNCQWITLEENAGKDKKIFTELEKIENFKKRKILGMTQVEFAKYMNTSRNTIQRSEKYAKKYIKQKETKNVTTDL